MAGVLPDTAFGAGEAAYGEAVELDQFPGRLRFQMPLRLRRWTFGARRYCLAGNQGVALVAMVEAVAAEDAPDTVGREDDAAPAGPGKLSSDAPGTEAGIAKGEGNDSLFDPRRCLVRHPRWAPLTGTEGVQAPLLHLLVPAVVGRAMDAELSAGLADAHFAGTGEEGQTETMDYVIIGHRWRQAPSLVSSPREVCPHLPLPASVAGSGLSVLLGDCGA